MNISRNEHGIINAIFILASIIVFLLWLNRDEPEWFSGAAELADITVNLCVGYLVSYVFYIINIYNPQKRKILNDCNFAGDCLAYMVFNQLQLSDILNGKSTQAIFLGALGNSFMPNANNMDKTQLSLALNRYANDLQSKLIQNVRSNIPESELSINKLMFKISLGGSNDQIFTAIAEKDYLIKSFNDHIAKFGESDSKLTKQISKRALIKLKLLNQSEIDKLPTLELGIQYGNKKVEFQPRS